MINYKLVFIKKKVKSLVISGVSYVAVAAALTALGIAFGIVGGMEMFGLITVVGNTLMRYGIKFIIKAIYAKCSKTESVKISSQIN
ncbi:hypothetical protein SAMD00079811_77620 (plasmid) [Scytonema sp. HK-05]|uniref:hypothetical protein n=1 Tax=Scytonema sp. HK-05 TaxID=1137095 RepID=UPI000937C60B|nr:hypothetical protein [Scytonema sp. HK-05]OKH59449.1 hypothetical protein NIES2130_09020 [Scytonema sp. HK-05]BAY50133.1 hypothetical protein SAMD00079811_77620 [Scytonema sp. HK-05]